MENATLNDEYGYVKDSKVFLKGYLDFPDRQIGEVKRTEQEAIDYFKNRFNIVLNKVEQLEREIDEALNKGSYLTKLIQLQRKLKSFDALGDFVPLLRRLEEKEEYLKSLIEVNQLKNLEIKRALIEDVKVAAAVTDYATATDQIQEIKAKWIRTGPVDKEYQEEIETTFQQILDDFFQRRRDYFDEQNKLNQHRIEEYEKLIKITKTLSYAKDLDEAYAKARDVRNAWNNIGEVPPKRFFKVNKAYRHFLKLFYDKYNAAKGIEPKVRVDPRIVEQQKLLAQAETLLKSPDIIEASQEAKVLLSKWKEIKIPFKLADKELAERFRMVCDKIFELSYLARVISRKYPAFDLKSPEEQLRTKYRELEWLTKREKSDLEFAQLEFDRTATGDPEQDKQAVGRINIQKRKVQMKERILIEFERKLKAITG
ncbi:hypothetical protein J2Y45_000321 [Dyadobacter sp. BE34]|uniref:DUF349 domain-containing protein n=1 Tax=Dyadobacter fermentans TaxID=94254 RepID=A0ABU1QPH5_9BACT|nr:MULTISPECIES: DUF349 domain-containing protein [Dyadobacter]MBZ1358403.1 DUF349 domain-containing protein [Dyadobacter fermentans]MDR6803051.1 hypothetical protein [Dyadobacter fermentans]MDR7040793.1 hypothetical protein [Dyadobacter sp. BE242]MDR7195195.1 hypothetical protein [Dyadobacter sp. BE34]MDR7214260.1 hypothetical protein [Dyadobacter sp. BE31]